MKNMRRLFTAVVVVSLLLVQSVFAEKTPIENLYEYTLDNGLTVFIAENHAVPLAYVEIAVKAGAITQTKENAGLFHLYEHMMFKGNSLYPNAASVKKALSDMGVADWNGTTGIDHVNYFFTIPSDQLEKGLAFWNAAIRSPLMDAKELENEKKVVLAEIEGDASDPGSWVRDYYLSKMFPKEPYRLDPSGSSPVVKNATVAQMKDMQSKYYIPKNAALFIGGDVNPEETLELVKNIYGTWSNNGNEAPEKNEQASKEPFSEMNIAVLPYDKISPEIAKVELSFRGPDADFEREDTYTADYLLQLLSDPDGYFAKTLVGTEELGIPDVDYVSGGYGTSRAAGLLECSAVMLHPEQNILARVKLFEKIVREDILPKVALDKKNFSKKKIEAIARSLRDDDTVTSQTATGLLSVLRFWWCCTDADYYYTYNDKITSVTSADMQGFVQKYIEGKKPMVIVMLNPAVYEKVKGEFAEAGADEITDNFVWWKMDKFQPDESKIAKGSRVLQDTQIYVPVEKAVDNGSKKENAHDIETYILKNGIPVYVKNVKGAKMSSVYVSLLGGIEHMTKETSGLEGALFDMMASSSKKYSYASRQSIAFRTGASVGAFSKIGGSGLGVTSISSYFDEMLSILGDSFVNPVFEQKVYDNYMTEARQDIQQMLNDPRSLMMYKMDETLYENHPYSVSASVTPSSIENITVENMKALYDKIIRPEDMYVVAGGNINAKKLVAALNKTIGSIKAGKGSARVALEVPPLKISGANVIMTHPSAQGSGYVARVFASPSIHDSDYVAAAVASQVYSDTMFNVVREHHGACYTPSSGTGGNDAPFGYEFLFKLSDVKNFAKYMEEARNYMASDKLIESVNDKGEYEFTTVENRLDGYKNSFINTSYASQQTVGSMTASILNNIRNYSDPYYSEKRLEQIRSLTADDIKAAFKKYWVDEKSQWFVMVGPEDEANVNLPPL